MINNGIALKGPATRSSGVATGTPTTTRASSISTTTGPTTRTTTSASADPRKFTRPGAGNAGEGLTLGREIPGAEHSSPKARQHAQPKTVAGPAGAVTERGEQLPRIVCQFSCGAASAVATKLALAKYGTTHDIQIVNAFVLEEHEDNRRFLTDCEGWFGQQVTVFRDEKFEASIIKVFQRRQFMKGPRGAPCSLELKKKLLAKWALPGDVMVFGFTMEEQDRFEDFVDRNPDLPALAPLIDAGLGKEDCKAMVERAGIVLPYMYRLGYDNANCKGCVKGGEGYWRAIRYDFPVEFEAICIEQDHLGPGSWFLRYRSGPMINQRFPLRDLPDGPIVRNEAVPACSFFCELAEQEYSA